MAGRPQTVTVASHFGEQSLRRIEQAVRELSGGRVLYDKDLVAPPRWPGDTVGERDFRRSPQEQRRFLDLLGEAEVLLDFPRDVDAPLAEVAPGLRWVQGAMAGAGPVAREAGLLDTDVTVTTAGGVFSAQLAEFVLGAMLDHAKGFERLRANRKRRLWHEGAVGTLEGKTLCIVGTGSIGRAISHRARPFGMRLVGVKRTVREGDAGRAGVEEVYPTEKLREAVADADYVAITLPHTPQTEGLVGREALAAMKPGVHVTNVGRGAVLDEAALVENLETGHVSGAALDVFAVEPLPPESPLWSFENVIVSPHATDNAPHVTEEKLVALFVRNLGRYARGEPLENELDKELLY